MKKFAINQKRFKYGTLATVITVIFIAVIVLVNIVASMLLERFPLKLDLTADKIFTLSDQSVDFLKTIDEEIEVTVLSEEASLSTASTYAKQAVEIIQKYAAYSDKIKINFINPDKNPEIITKFNDLYKGDVSSQFVIITNGERIKTLTSSDLISQETNYTTDYSSTYTTITSTAEQSMTSALMYVVDKNPMKATILTTESLADITGLTDLLKANNYDVEEVDLLSGTIDQESALVLLNSPTNDLTDNEIAKLDAYISNDGKLGKNLVYLAAYGQKATPNLDAFLAEWGLEVGTGYVMDSNQSNMVVIQNGVYGVNTTISNKTYGAELQNPALSVVTVLSRPVNVLFETADNGRKAESLLATADTAYIVPDDADENTTIDSLEKKSVDVMAVGTKTTYNNNVEVKSSVLVVGSGLMVNSIFTTSANLNNGDYALSALNTMTGKSAGISIVAKNLTQATLSMTAAQTGIVRNIAIFVIPLIIIIAGIVVWVRRRNR